MRANTEADFWPRVEKTEGCWLWRGRAHRSGRYGEMSWAGGAEMAHRLAYEFANGPIAAGMEVLHSCDNGYCVKPEHLSLGTHLDNMRDAARKDRVAHGDRSGTARLSGAQVTEIRRRRAAGHPTTVLGRDFGVHPSTVSRLTRGEQWARDRGPLVASMSPVERGRLSHGPLGPLRSIAARTDIE